MTQRVESPSLPNERKRFPIVCKDNWHWWRCVDCGHVYEHERHQAQCVLCEGEVELAPHALAEMHAKENVTGMTRQKEQVQ